MHACSPFCAQSKTRSVMRSENLEDFILHSIGLPFTNSNTHDFVEPLILGGRGLEKRSCAKVVVGWGHLLAPSDPGVNFRGSVSDPTVRHQNERTVVGPQQQTHVLLIGPVRAKQEKV